MSVRHYGDVLLSHPEFAVIGDAASLVNPSTDSFFSWSFGDNVESASDDTPSTVGDADSLATDSLDGFGITIGELPFTFDFDDLDSTNDATPYAERTDSSAGSDLFLTSSGSNGSAETVGLALTIPYSLSASSHHQDQGLGFDEADGFGPSTNFSFDAFGSWGTSTHGPAVPPSESAPAFDIASKASSGDSAAITLLDVDFFAKGGNPGSPDKGGGGGSGGGGGNGGGGGDPGVLSDYFAGSENGDAGYDIWIQFQGDGWTTEFQNAFTQAADYFTTVITEDIGGGARYHGKMVDDLYVTAELTAIDGIGGVLGQAGPNAVWSANELTAAGMMQFDVADAQYYFDQGLWGDIVTHEFMHVLGFGSLWNYGDNPLVSGDQYLGEYGVAAYELFNPEADGYIPVEVEGGAGTAGSHWDEGALDNELMTGYIDPNNYLSEFSVVSLADLGYQVQYQPDGLLVA